MRSTKYNRLTVVSSIVWGLVIVSLFTGLFLTKTSKEKLINQYIDGENIINIAENVYKKDSAYFIFSSGLGYGGKITCLVKTETNKIESVQVIKHSETKSYYKRCEKFISDFSGYNIANAAEYPDAISGATLTSNAIQEAVAKSNFMLTGKAFTPNKKITLSKATPFLILLILLSLSSIFIKNKSVLKLMNWVVLLSSLIVVGFWMNKPLTLSFFTQIIIFQPQSLFSNPDAYLLLFYAIISIVFFRKNLYCKHICPFGAFQECCSAALKPANKLSFGILFKLPLLLTGLALIPAVLFRAPGLASFEIYSGIFDLKLSVYLYILFIIVIVLMFFINRPWCKLFCPAGAVLNFLLKTRIKLWKR